MEIEGKDGSKFQLKEGIQIDFGRGLGFDSTDRTVSRRHVSFQLPISDHKDENRVCFKVIGKNPIWVHYSNSGEIRVYKRFERGEMESGDMFCISAKKLIWFTLKRLELGGENKNRMDTESGLEIELDESLQSNFDLRGIEELEIESIDASTFDPVKESFSNYFSNYGEITDSVIMMDKLSGRPRGFGFVTFADHAVADKVLEEDHVIDGRAVEVKRTVPREDMQVKGVLKTRKIFVGGIPLSLTEDELKEYFSSYGNVIEHQIMLDHKTGRSRGFGFVTFDNEDAVDKIFTDGQIHELGGKRVEIKKAEPKRAISDYGNDSRVRRGGGGNSKSYGGFGRGAAGYGGGYGGKPGRGYGAHDGYESYGGYGDYGGYDGYGGGSAGLYAGYGGYGYGFGFGGPMYGAAGYGGYGTPGSYGGTAGYGGGKGYGGGGGYGSKGYGGGGDGYGGSSGGGGYDGGKGYGNGGASSGRYHPYRK